MLLSTFVEQDVERGVISRVLGSITRDGITYLRVQWTNGEVWDYLDQHAVLNTGEVCRQVARA